MDDERKARITDLREQAERVVALLRKMERGYLPEPAEVRIVTRLIRLLVEWWV